MRDMGIDVTKIGVLRNLFAAALKDFAASNSTFRILRSIPASSPSVSPVNRLYVLDSSFNPPTRAHLKVAVSAFQSDPVSSPKRLLLLLAIQNADKPPKPVSFEDRLVMMTLLAQELQTELQPHSSPVVDVAVTKEPYFYRKALVIDESGLYQGVEQVHLIGFDTLIRIFDKKYYSPEQGFATLEPFLSKHCLRVTMRTDDQWGGLAEQMDYVQEIRQGEREAEGLKKGWGDRIELVEGKKEGETVVSSSEARRVVESGKGDLGSYLSRSVEELVTKERFYRTEK